MIKISTSRNLMGLTSILMITQNKGLQYIDIDIDIEISILRIYIGIITKRHAWFDRNSQYKLQIS